MTRHTGGYGFIGFLDVLQKIKLGPTDWNCWFHVKLSLSQVRTDVKKKVVIKLDASWEFWQHLKCCEILVNFYLVFYFRRSYLVTGARTIVATLSLSAAMGI